MFCDNNYLGHFIFIVWYNRWQRKTAKVLKLAWLEMNDGKYDIMQLANQEANLPILKEWLWKNAELDLRCFEERFQN